MQKFACCSRSFGAQGRENLQFYKICNLHSIKQVREKRLRINMAEIRRMLNTDDIQGIIWLPTELQLANALAKRRADANMLLDFISSGQIQF